MIKEAIAYLVDQGAKSQVPLRVAKDDVHEEVYLYGDKVVRIPIRAKPRNHIVPDLDHFISAFDFYAESELVAPIWVSDACVVSILDDNGLRLNKITLPLILSSAFIALSHCGEWIDQRSLIRLLRIDLRGTIPDAILLDRIRKVQFENGQIVSQTSTKSRESMGKQITSQVTGEGEIPDEVILDVPVFFRGESYSVVCSVEIDAMRAVFRLAPCPGELDRIKTIAVGETASRLSEAVSAKRGIVFVGTP